MNVNEFIKYLNEQVDNGSIYVWGAQGQKAPTVNETWIRRMEKATGGTEINGHYETYAAIAVTAWRHKVQAGYGDMLRAFDCSGLGVYFFLKHKLIPYDMNANALMKLCDAAEKPGPGFWVFRIDKTGRATHIGYMISDKELVEAKGRAYGVVKTEFKEKDWMWIGKPKIFDFEPEPQPVPPAPQPTEKAVKVVGGSVHVREGNGKGSKSLGTVHNAKYYREHEIDKPGDVLPYRGQAATEPYWYEVEYEGQAAYISSKKQYTKIVEVST